MRITTPLLLTLPLLPPSTLSLPTPPASFSNRPGIYANTFDSNSTRLPTLYAGLSDPNMYGAYFCTDTNWGGQCLWSQRLLDYCVTLGDPWLDSISSFGPDPGFTCALFETPACDGDDLELAYPGTPFLPGVGWNDRAQSFRCWRT
ncbi:hypothetical protein K490DRAFT_58077 [Saccharata proteae CBS 121410]|uniref:Uncharacterized protein n=1 Tax=Saccharata proteae CBS 121410 TaxID=1314787 RepID=A0A9P4LVM2_9PEZI|nr:hypothetical protein K490DRAFT_58077 [Saccharata proteae CBS 121410]